MQLTQRLSRHVTEALLPVWKDVGVDPRTGGFHERLDIELRPIALPYQRLLTQCRQVFSFSAGATLADLPWARDIAARGFRFLRESFEDRQRGGWKFALGEGGPLPSTTRQLYAHAFVPLACWAQLRVNDDDEAARTAQRTLEYLDEHLRAPSGGFYTAVTEDHQVLEHSLQQNPHMHLFESCMFMADVTKEMIFIKMAQELSSLFLDRFLDQSARTLVEHFDASWSPDAKLGHVREPGHHFEWCWLVHRWLDVAERLKVPTRAEELSKAAADLLSWAIDQGTDPERGGIFDEVGPQGTALKETKRIWPVCEALKALAFRAPGSANTRRLEDQAQKLGDLLFDHYLTGPGTWNEVLARDLTPATNYLPSTTLYHIVMCARELTWLERRAATSLGPQSSSSDASPRSPAPGP